MIQTACLARLYSHTLLHFTYLVFVLYKDVKSCVHFDDAGARLECTPDLAEVN